VLNVFSLWWRQWQLQQQSPPVPVFFQSSAIVFIAPKATNNAIPATVVSHNAHAVPSVGFL